MNKRIAKLGVVSLLSLVMSSQAMAAFVLNGTRFIYDEGKKNISFEVTNQSTETYGGQVWIDNTNQDNAQVYMVPAPPFFKVAPKEKQIVRIMKNGQYIDQRAWQKGVRMQKRPCRLFTTMEKHICVIRHHIILR